MFDIPRHDAFEPEPSGDATSWLIAEPGVKGALIELVSETAERLGVRSPVTEQDFQAIMADRLFLQRVKAVVAATLFT